MPTLIVLEAPKQPPGLGLKIETRKPTAKRKHKPPLDLQGSFSKIAMCFNSFLCHLVMTPATDPLLYRATHTHTRGPRHQTLRCLLSANPPPPPTYQSSNSDTRAPRLPSSSSRKRSVGSRSTATCSAACALTRWFSWLSDDGGGGGGC